VVNGGGLRRAISVFRDILGENRGHLPRHAKVYRNFAAEFDRLQQERIAAYREFIADVVSGTYSEPQYVVAMKPR
jgi:3-methyl-2-oxobutanoate hydroxymethyltransferase